MWLQTYDMFNGATTFNQEVVDWKLPNVTSMNRVFNGASAFKQRVQYWTLNTATGVPSLTDSLPVPEW